MKLDHKGWAILVIVLGIAVVTSYTLGRRQSAEVKPVPPPSAGMVTPGTALPSNHPPIGSADNAAAMPSTMPPAVAGDQSRFTHFRVGNRNVKSLLLDGHYIWIGTSGGVIRYDIDSDTHKVFDNKIDGLISNGIFHLSRIGDRLFVGTYGGGLSIYDINKDKWKDYNIPDGLADQFVYDVLQTETGDLWIATWSGANLVRGGRLDDPKSWVTFDVENTGGGLPNRWVYALDEDQKGNIWFATEDGLARYADGQWRHWKHKDGLGAPYEIVKDAIQSTNDPAAASRHHAMNKKDEGLQGINVAYNPNYIISLQVDKDGIVWAGTWGAGLARFDGKTWKNYTTADGLPANHIFMLNLDPQGRLWIGTNHGLARMKSDGSGFDVMKMADGLFADNVFSTAFGADGTLWAGSFGGVARIAPRP